MIWQESVSVIWYQAKTPDTGVAWWAVEHMGHPAFFLRALMAGDFAPGRLPLPRHILTLTGEQLPERVACACGTCGETPVVETLDIIERATGRRGFLEVYRAGPPRGARWPAATDPASCWLCSSKRDRATRAALVAGAGEVTVCENCAAYLARR